MKRRDSIKCGHRARVTGRVDSCNRGNWVWSIVTRAGVVCTLTGTRAEVSARLPTLLNRLENRKT